MLSRRQFLTSAAFPVALEAGGIPCGALAAQGEPTVQRLETRVLEVNGKPAKVYGIRQSNGTGGISTDVTRPYRVRVVNALGTDSLIHWHGLTPPYKQDGVPGVSGPPIPGGTADYNFSLRVAGTFWMHSHVGLQEQLLLAAPLIIHARAERRNEHEIVVMLADFPFTPPEEIFASLRKASMAAMGPAAAPDLNDVKYDAFLANDRTLADPDVVKVDPGGSVRLRVINSSSMSSYMIDLGPLAADGGRRRRRGSDRRQRLPISVARRLDLRIRLPRGPGAYPVFAHLRLGRPASKHRLPPAPLVSAARSPGGALLALRRPW